jgi:hypothetical protein
MLVTANCSLLKAKTSIASFLLFLTLLISSVKTYAVANEGHPYIRVNLSGLGKIVKVFLREAKNWKKYLTTIFLML